ncbi:uncharacterized protein [Dysidea avara]|uniref:uncharacterized protein isoform X3 n=1 Tax=Dysidea avara TaxID=196820 RepID=UPI00332CB99D
MNYNNCMVNCIPVDIVMVVSSSGMLIQSQSISVNTLESFERTPVHKKLPSPHKQLQVVNNEGSSQPTNQSEPSSPTSKTAGEATNKETASAETTSKESTWSQSSDVKTDEPTTPKSKTLPANKQVTPVKHSQEWKSETMAHTPSKSNEKKQCQPKTPDNLGGWERHP